MIRGLIILLIFFSGTTLTPRQEVSHGLASFYADRFEGRPTASGEPYRKNEYTAAHRTLPFGTRVMVTNTRNDKSVIVRINDRGPHVKRRIIDVSRAAAEELDFIKEGVTQVSLKVLTNDE